MAILVRAWDVLGAGLVQRGLPPTHALIDAVDRFIHKQTTFAQKIGTEVGTDGTESLGIPIPR